MLIGGIIALMGLLYGLTVAQRRVHEKREADARRRAESEIATIVERSELTAWGAVWTASLSSPRSSVSSAAPPATTVFQQIEAASLSSLVALILFGLAFTTLRRRHQPLRSIGPVAHRLAAAVIVIAEVLLTGSGNGRKVFQSFRYSITNRAPAKSARPSARRQKNWGAGGVCAV